MSESGQGNPETPQNPKEGLEHQTNGPQSWQKDWDKAKEGGEDDPYFRKVGPQHPEIQGSPETVARDTKVDNSNSQ